MKKLILAIALFAISASALAHDEWKGDGRIVQVIPRTEFVTEYRRGEVCNGWPTRREGQYRFGDRNYNRQHDGSPVTGAIVGALIGSQIGGGDGRVAATAIGSVVGAAVGNSNRDQYRYDRRDYRYDNRRAGDCHIEEYPVRVSYRYYEIVYENHGYLRTVKSYEHPRGRYYRGY